MVTFAAILLVSSTVLLGPAAGEGPPLPEGAQGPAFISSPQNGSIHDVNFGIEFTSEVLNSSTFGEPVEFWWDFGDGNGSTEVTPRHAYSREGNYTVVLTLTDNRGNVTTASVSFSVVYPPLPQVTIVAGSGVPRNYSASEVIEFSATGLLTGPEGPQLRYVWDFGDGKVMEGSAPEHSYAQPGTYNVTVTVSDGHSYSRDSIQVIVKARPPVADNGMLCATLAISVVLLVGFVAFFGGTEAGLLMLMPLLLLLYSKIKKEQILDNYTRGQIHGYIIANPGDHYSSIKNALDLNNGTLDRKSTRLNSSH
jgi:chitodextrinase